jgi:GNAT superfamily N-acetyltransferase
MIGIDVQIFDRSMRKDLLKIRNIVDTMASELYDELRTYEFPLLRNHNGRMETDTQWLTSYLDNSGTVLVAFKDTEAVGFAVIAPDPEFVSTYAVLDLFVYKDHRGKGIGKLLITTLEEYARGVLKARNLVITVHALNNGASRLYKRKSKYREFSEKLMKRL